MIYRDDLQGSDLFGVNVYQNLTIPLDDRRFLMLSVLFSIAVHLGVAQRGVHISFSGAPDPVGAAIGHQFSWIMDSVFEKAKCLHF